MRRIILQDGPPLFLFVPARRTTGALGDAFVFAMVQRCFECRSSQASGKRVSRAAPWGHSIKTLRRQAQGSTRLSLQLAINDISSAARSPAGGASGKQYGQLKGGQWLRSTFCSTWPLPQPSCRKLFVTKPEALTVVYQHLERGEVAVSKDKDGAAERILLEDLSAKPR